MVLDNAVELWGMAAANLVSVFNPEIVVFGGVRSRELTTFTRQLSILQDAGLPILRSLRILAGQQKAGRLKYSLEDTCDEIEAGSTLSEGMAKSPKCFNRLYVNMIKAGEAGGALELILQRLADFMERAESLKRKVKGAMIYPCSIVAVAIIVVAILLVFVIPVFAELFGSMGKALPAPTQILINISDFMRSPNSIARLSSALENAPVMNQTRKDRFAQQITDLLVREHDVRPLAEVEMSFLGTSHVAVGAYLAGSDPVVYTTCPPTTTAPHP